MAGGVRGGTCIETVPCEHGSRHSWRQPLRVGSGPRPARRGSDVRNLRAQYHLSPLVCPVLRVHVPCRVCAQYMYVCYVVILALVCELGPLVLV
jgi:hypothetical protein